VRSRDIDLFYVPKIKVIEAFSSNGLVMDYEDKSREEDKSRLAQDFEKGFTPAVRKAVASTLIDLIGPTAVHSYIDRVRARLSALPQEIRLVLRHESAPLVFSSVMEVTHFLGQPDFQMIQHVESYVYEMTYSDGTVFERTVTSIEDLRTLHDQIQVLSEHVSHLS